MTLSVDLHAHTRFFHGAPWLARAYDPLGGRLLAAAARQRGLDAVATTNHDYYRNLGLGGDALTVLPGIEVSTTRGHVIVVGPSPPRRTLPGELTPQQVVEIAHERDCAAIIAHPFRNSTVRETDADFDAVELNGKGTESPQVVREYARDVGLPLVGGSDAHYPFEVGRARTEVDVAPGASPADIVDAIRDGRVEPVIDDSPLQRVLRAGYRLSHGQKGWLGDEPIRPPGVGTPPGEQQTQGDHLPRKE